MHRPQHDAVPPDRADAIRLPRRPHPRGTAVPDDARHWRTALVVSFVARGIRPLFSALLPLFLYETYYLDWSRALPNG